MKPHPPQLALRLDAATQTTDAPWRAGGTLVYLGEPLTLVLDTACRLPERVGAELHLPLPPAATPRQIRDAAESWLRDAALRLFSAIAQNSALAGRRPYGDVPRTVLTFGKRGDWACCTDGELRCHWRLIEQPRTVIEQVLASALAGHRAAPASADLFALA